MYIICSIYKVYSFEEMISTLQLNSGNEKPVLLVGSQFNAKAEKLTALIAHLYTNEPDACILVTAPTNIAADLLTLGLLCEVSSDNIIRAISIKAELQQIVELSDIEFDAIQVVNRHLKMMPTFDKVRIVLCTASMSLSLWNKYPYFTHIVVDECAKSAHTNELIKQIVSAKIGKSCCKNIVLTAEFWPPFDKSHKCKINLP